MIDSYITAYIEESKLWNGVVTSENDTYISINHKVRLRKDRMAIVNDYKDSSEYKYNKANGDTITLIVEK